MGGDISASPYAAYFYYIFQQLPETVYLGATYTSRHGISFTPSSLESWNSFTDALRVDFNSTSFTYSKFGPTTQTTLRGTGHAIYAKGIGLVYLEITHTDPAGTNYEKTETLTYNAKGVAQSVTFRGSLHISGADGIGYSVSPCCYLDYLPSTAFTSITSGHSFEITQYALPGCYIQLKVFKTGTTDSTAFKVVMPNPLASIIELGEIGGVGDGGLLTP